MLKGLARPLCDGAASGRQLHALYGQEVWVMCLHFGAIETARLVHDMPGIKGDALCGPCRAACDAEAAPTSELRLACGGCVRMSWPVTGDS